MSININEYVQQIIEMAKKYGKEVSLSICDDGAWITIGDPFSVKAKICPIVLHTHFQSEKLSMKDIEEAISKNIPVLCAIHVNTGETQCIIEGMELREQSVEPHYLFTLEKILEHLTLLEEHLKDYPCFEDCITKHGIALRGYLSEMLSFAPESERAFWEEIKRKVEDYLREIVSKKLTLEGAIKLREIRKEIQNKILWKEKPQQEVKEEVMEMGEEYKISDTLKLVIEELEKIEKMMKEDRFSKKELRSSLNFAIGRLYEILIKIQRGEATMGESVVIDRWTWELDKPKTPSEREELFIKYGERCFLDPETRGFPICVKVGRPDEGKISCDGLRSAFVRARALITASKRAGRMDLAMKYDEISKKALELARKLGCRWVRDQYPEKLSENLNIQSIKNNLGEEKMEIPKWERGKRYTPIPFEGELPPLLKKAKESCLDVLADLFQFPI